MISGKAVRSTLADLADPRAAALIIVDLQNDFCAANGLWHQRGHSLTGITSVVANTADLVAHARHAGVKIIFIQMVMLPNAASLSPAYLRFIATKTGLAPDQMGCELGSWGAEIIAALAPEPGDIIVQKWRSSAFLGTNLELILRGAGVETVIVCGAATYACVESTIRDAFNKDFYVIEVEDCVGGFNQDLHEASLQIMRSRIDVIPRKMLIDVWQGLGVDPD
ncbi:MULTISPECIES: isochorismatase family cysteine hydrolase [unclassified Sphingobium]|uniref:isochorismatase family cysteine hydrolase n=1 Tax=unclassified Sphingobium TaxID=2611147 RepID=UPI0035A61E10